MSLNTLRILFFPMIATVLAACGSSSDSDVTESDVALRFSDAPVDGLSSVVITVDQIIFKRDGEDDIVVDTFTSEELGVEDADTFEIDLLAVQGNDNLLVLDSVVLPVGDYQDLRINVLDDDINFSYVDEIASGDREPIKVPSDQLKLGSFEVSPRSTQTFVIEFGLRQAMTYNPGPDRYILKPRGVRVVELETASSVSGVVDLADIHLTEPCALKSDSSVNNVAYLYEGHGLDVGLLGDVFDADDENFDSTLPEGTIAPEVATTIDGATGEYLFSYLLPGDYTLALSCVAESDDPVAFDDIAIPSPAGMVLEIEVPRSSDVECDFPNVDGCVTNRASSFLE